MTYLADRFHTPIEAKKTKKTKKRNKGKQAVRVLVSFPFEFLKGVDKLATKEARSRSELVREALRQYMKQAVKED